MKSVLYLVVIVLVVGGVIFFYNKNTSNTEEQLTKVMVGHIGLANDLPAYVAFEKGFFTERGLDVELKKLESSKLASDALYAGGIDVSAGSSAVNLLAAEATDPGKIVFYALGRTGKAESATLGGFIVLDSSPITSIQNLAGKKIAVFPGNTATALLGRYFEKYNVDASGIQWQKMVPANWLPSLDSGAVDAVYAYEPTFTIAKNRTENPVRVVAFGALEDEIDPLYLGGSAMSARFVAEHADAAQAYVEAYYQGIDFIKENEAEARAILAKHMSIPENIASKMNLYPDDKVGEIQKDKFQMLADLLLAEGEITGAVDVMRDNFYYFMR